MYSIMFLVTTWTHRLNGNGIHGQLLRLYSQNLDGIRTVIAVDSQRQKVIILVVVMKSFLGITHGNVTEDVGKSKSNEERNRKERYWCLSMNITAWSALDGIQFTMAAWICGTAAFRVFVCVFVCGLHGVLE